MRELTELSLHTHWPDAAPEVPDYTGLTGPTGVLDTLSRLMNLTKLTIGMHMLLSKPERDSNNEIRACHHLRPATTLPPGLHNLTIYHCHKCSKAWYPKVPVPALAEVLVFELATERSSGNFYDLERVRYMACETDWYNPFFDRTIYLGTRFNRKGKAWSLGRFVQSFDLFQRFGVDFEAYTGATCCIGV